MVYSDIEAARFLAEVMPPYCSLCQASFRAIIMHGIFDERIPPYSHKFDGLYCDFWTPGELVALTTRNLTAT